MRTSRQFGKIEDLKNNPRYRKGEVMEDAVKLRDSRQMVEI